MTKIIIKNKPCFAIIITVLMENIYTLFSFVPFYLPKKVPKKGPRRLIPPSGGVEP